MKQTFQTLHWNTKWLTSVAWNNDEVPENCTFIKCQKGMIIRIPWACHKKSFIKNDNYSQIHITERDTKIHWLSDQMAQEDKEDFIKDKSEYIIWRCKIITHSSFYEMVSIHVLFFFFFSHVGRCWWSCFSINVRSWSGESFLGMNYFVFSSSYFIANTCGVKNWMCNIKNIFLNPRHPQIIYYIF